MNKPRCRVSKKLLGVYIREVPHPEDSYQMWESLVDGSNVHIGTSEPDELDPDNDTWLAAAETEEWSMSEDNYLFLTEFTTFKDACDAVKKHLKNHKQSLYWPDDDIRTGRRF